MEEAKIDKRTKEYKQTSTKFELDSESTESYIKMRDIGIPIKEAVFRRTVKSWTGEPETAFYSSGAKPSRTATMWLTPCGLLCEQAKGKRVIVGSGNINYSIPE